MRPSFTVSLLLLLSLLIPSEQVQGIRLKKESYKSVGQHKSTHVEEVTLSKTNNINGVTEEAVVCRDGKYCSGNNRKLMSVTPSTTTTTTTTTSKNEKNGKNKADPISNGEKGRTVNLLRTSEEQPDQFEHYPDVVDLAEMDYSPARRKTPIHN